MPRHFEGEEAFYCSTEGKVNAFEEMPEGGGHLATPFNRDPKGSQYTNPLKLFEK